MIQLLLADTTLETLVHQRMYKPLPGASPGYALGSKP